MIAALLPVLAPILGDIIKKVIPDSEGQAKAEAEAQMMLMQRSAQIEQAAADVVKTEAQSEHWLTATWRPIVMLTLTGMIVARWMGYSAPGISEAEALKLWSIVEIGACGREDSPRRGGGNAAPMKGNFSACLEVVLHHEGGWSDHKDDPGGATMKGITLTTYSNFLGRPATKDELRNIPDEHVETIYRRHYWDRVAGDGLPDGLDLSVFDMAVNAGVSRAGRMLQEIVGSQIDKSIGKKTLAAVAEQDTLSLIRQYSEERRRFYKSLKTFPVFGRGWLRRVNEVEAKAKEMQDDVR